MQAENKYSAIPLRPSCIVLFIIYGALNVNAIKSAMLENDIKLHIPLAINHVDRASESCNI